jgi:hypothetical protein
MSTPLKKCIDCGYSKKTTEFPFDKSRNRYLSVCKICTSIRTQDYQKQNPEKWKQYGINNDKKRKEFINKWKSQGCQKCGDTRLYLIDAHHIDSSQKEISISDSYGLNKIKEELLKCLPLCRNCHAEFHHLEKTQELSLKEYLERQLL